MLSADCNVRSRVWQLVTAVLLLVLFCSAQTPQITRIDITESGVYTVDEKEAGPPAASGVPRRAVANARLEQSTRFIPLRKGVHFGFRYSIVGTPDGAPAQLRIVTLYPPGGLKNPALRAPIQRSEFSVTRKIGGEYSSYHGVALDFDWALVPGNWTIEIWSGDRRLASEIFTLVTYTRPK